jgi:hypothetical protein
MCPIGTTCLPADCCFSKLLFHINPNKHVGLVQSGHHHYLLFSPWYTGSWKIVHLALNNNNLLTQILGAAILITLSLSVSDIFFFTYQTLRHTIVSQMVVNRENISYDRFTEICDLIHATCEDCICVGQHYLIQPYNTIFIEIQVFLMYVRIL